MAAVVLGPKSVANRATAKRIDKLHTRGTAAWAKAWVAWTVQRKSTKAWKGGR